MSTKGSVHLSACGVGSGSPSGGLAEIARNPEPDVRVPCVNRARLHAELAPRLVVEPTSVGKPLALLELTYSPQNPVDLPRVVTHPAPGLGATQRPASQTH
jgi:hypothetical protein